MSFTDLQPNSWFWVLRPMNFTIDFTGPQFFAGLRVYAGDVSSLARSLVALNKLVKTIVFILLIP